MLCAQLEFPNRLKNQELCYRNHICLSSVELTIDQNLRRLQQAIAMRVLMVVSDVSLQSLSVRTKRRQLLNRRSLVRGCNRYAKRHIILILILRRWKIIIVERSQFQSILKDSGVVRFLVRLNHNQRDRD